MATLLASIYGTEKDKVNCSFYFKIGACRHGETCSRKHIKPTFSPTICLPNLYRNPTLDPFVQMTPEQLQEHLDLFYEDLFLELSKFGELKDMVICDNVGEHLVGNVYVMFGHAEEAMRCMHNLNERFYAGRPIYAELSPVTDFREACCRQFDMNQCNRGGFCNFMHSKKPSHVLRKALFAAQIAEMRLRRGGTEREEREVDRREKDRDRGKERSRDRDRDRHRERDRDHERSREHRDRDRERDKDRDRHGDKEKRRRERDRDSRESSSRRERSR